MQRRPGRAKHNVTVFNFRLHATMCWELNENRLNFALNRSLYADHYAKNQFLDKQRTTVKPPQNPSDRLDAILISIGDTLTAQPSSYLISMRGKYLQACLRALVGFFRLVFIVLHFTVMSRNRRYRQLNWPMCRSRWLLVFCSH